MNEQHFSDFYKVPDITFDIKKLRAELDRVDLKILKKI